VLIVGFSDDVVTARSFARRGEEIVANRELLALGVANVGSALVPTATAIPAPRLIGTDGLRALFEAPVAWPWPATGSAPRRRH
jgi:hypothetical protein